MKIEICFFFNDQILLLFFKSLQSFCGDRLLLTKVLI